MIRKRLSLALAFLVCANTAVLVSGSIIKGAKCITRPRRCNLNCFSQLQPNVDCGSEPGEKRPACFAVKCNGGGSIATCWFEEGDSTTCKVIKDDGQAAEGGKCTDCQAKFCNCATTQGNCATTCDCSNLAGNPFEIASMDECEL